MAGYTKQQIDWKIKDALTAFGWAYNNAVNCLSDEDKCLPDKKQKEVIEKWYKWFMAKHKEKEKLTREIYMPPWEKKENENDKTMEDGQAEIDKLRSKVG
jgi:hypothetical protein